MHLDCSQSHANLAIESDSKPHGVRAWLVPVVNSNPLLQPLILMSLKAKPLKFKSQLGFGVGGFVEPVI